MDNYLNWNRYYSAYGGPSPRLGAGLRPESGPSPGMGFGPGLGFGQQFGPGMTSDAVPGQGFGQNLGPVFGLGFAPGVGQSPRFGQEQSFTQNFGQAPGFGSNFGQGSVQQVRPEMLQGPALLSAVKTLPVTASTPGTFEANTSGIPNKKQTASQNNPSLPQNTGAGGQISKSGQLSFNSASVNVSKCSKDKTYRVDKQYKKDLSESCTTKLKTIEKKSETKKNILCERERMSLWKKSENTKPDVGETAQSDKPDKISYKLENPHYIDNKREMENELNMYQTKECSTKSTSDVRENINGKIVTGDKDEMSVSGSGVVMDENNSANKVEEDSNGQDESSSSRTPSHFQLALTKALDALAHGKFGSSAAEHTNLNTLPPNVVRSLSFAETSNSQPTICLASDPQTMNTQLLQKELSGDVSEKQALVLKKNDDVAKDDSEDSDEDPGYVQSQLYIGNLAVNTSQKEILNLLKEYKVQQVWMAYHKNKCGDICAFVKVSSLKETRRIVKEMEEAFLRGKILTLRFAAASDFDDYDIRKPSAKSLKNKELPQSLSGMQASSAHLIVPVHSSSTVQTRATVNTVTTSSTQIVPPAQETMEYPTSEGLLPEEMHGTFQTGTSTAPQLTPNLQSLVSSLFKKTSNNSADVTCKVTSAQPCHQPALILSSTAPSHQSPPGQFSDLPLAGKKETDLAMPLHQTSTPQQSGTVSTNQCSPDMQSWAAQTLELSSKLRCATALARGKLNEQVTNKFQNSCDKKHHMREKDLVVESQSALTCQESKFLQYTQALYPNAPLLGVKYVTEYLGLSVCVQYICGLCGRLFQGSDIACHVVSFDHRMNFFKEECPSVYKELSEKRQSLTVTEIARECDQYALKYTVKNDCIRTVCHELVDQYVQLDLASLQTAGLKELREKRASLVQKISGTMTFGTALESKIDDLLHQAVAANPENKAIIGLKFITEIVEREPGSVTYTCGCCGVPVCETEIGGHILGTTHRQKFFEIERPNSIVNKVGSLGIKTHQELLDVCHHEAQQVEADEGCCQVLTISKAQQMLLEARYGQLIDQYKQQSKKINGSGKSKNTSSSEQPVRCGTKKHLSSSDLPIWCGTWSQWKPAMALVPFLGVPEVLRVAKPVQLEGGKGCVLYYRYLIREDKQLDCCAGLRHVTEIQKAGRGLYGYFCDLCKFTCQAPSVIHQHVCGYQHVINYLEQDHPYIYGKVLLESEEQVKKKMTDFHVRELRQTEGLEAINVVMVRLKDKQQGDNIISETVAREKKQSKLPQNLDKHRASLPSSESSEKPKGYQKHAEATRGDQKPAQKYEKSSQVLQKPSQMQQKAQVHQPSSKEFGKASETIQKPHKSQTSSKALRKPSQMQQKPSQEHQKSSQIHQKSSQIHQKSSQIHQNQKTSQMQQKPSQVHQEQSQVQQKPSQGQEKPSQLHQKPSQVQQKSSQVCQKQSQVQQKPSQVQQKPSQAQQKSSQICQKLSQVCQKPEVGKKPEQQQKDVLIHKNGPVSASHVRWKPDLDNINIYKLLKIECGEKPVIGLQYIHETIDKSSEDPISYQCKLCCLTFTIATICKHLTSFVHRFKYLEKNYTELCEQIKRAPQLLENYCCWIDATYGREDCVLRKVLIKDGKDGRPVYIEMKSVTDLEYTSPWKDVYSLEKLKQMSQTVQSKPQKPTAAEERIKEQVKDIMKDIEDKTADINKISHGRKEGQNKMMTDAESTGVAASVAERAGETYIWKKEYEKLRERISNQEIVKCQRRSKFLSTYGDQAGKIPLTGLKEITEFQLPDVNAQPWYLCFLCEKRLCSMKIFDHVTSHDHRLQYMKSNYQYLYDLVTSNNPAAMSVDGFAKEIASTEGDVREMEVMLELNSEIQNSTMEVRDKTSSSNQEVVRNKCDRKRLGSSDVSTKTVRPVLKDSDMQNSENNRFKENLSLEKGNNEKDCNVKRMRAVSSPGGSCNRDKQRKTHRSGPVKNSGSNYPLEKSCDPTESACQRNDKYVKRPSDDKFSAGKEGVPRSAENVQLKRTLESDSGSQENVEKQRTDSPRKKRMRSQAVSAVDSNLQKSSDKMTDINQDKNVRDSVKEEKKHNTLQQLIDEWPHTSMIGLDYICEIKHSVREDFPPLYRCDICGNTDSKHLAAREMLFHVCSRNHRESFFKNIRKDLFMEIQSNTTDQISYNSLLDQYAKLYQDRTSECFHTESMDDDLIWQRFQTPDKKMSPSTISSTVVQMKAGSPAVKISYYVSPSEIHLQLTDTDKTAVNELMKDMQVVYNNSVHDSHVKWEEGMFCAAFLMSEKLWYRGKITEIATPGQGFEVLLIDYGSKHRVSDHNLRCVLKQFRGLPCLSFCSKLCELKPANSLVEWPSSTNTLVKNVVQRRKLFLEKKGRVKDGKLPVDLLIESEDKLSGTKKYRSLSLILQREGVAVKEGLDNLSADSNFSSGMPVKTEVKSGPVCENESTSVRETEERENFTTLYSHDSTTGDFLNQGNLSGNIDPPNAESRFPVTLGVQSQVCFEYNHGFTDYNSLLEPIESSAMDSCFGLKDNSSYRSDIFSTEHLQEPFEVHSEQCMSEDLVPHINSDLDYPAFMHDPFQPNERVEASRFFGNDQSHYYDGTRVMQASTDYEDSMEIDYPQKSQQMVRDPPYLKCSFSAVHPVQAVQQDLVVGQEFCGTTELSFSSLKSLDSFDFGAAHVGSGLHLPKTRQDKRKRMRRRGKHDKKHFRPSEEHLGPSKEHFRSLNRYFGPSISNNKKLKRRRNRNKQNQSNKVAGGLLHDGTSTNDKPVEKDESGKSTKEIGSKEKASGILTSVLERLNASDEEDINLSESELQELEATLNSSNQFGSDASDQE